MKDKNGVPCEIECGITEEQAIDKLKETGWLPQHDQELVRGIIKRIREHQQVIDKALKVSSVDKDCYILAHEHIIDLLKKEWGIDG